MSTLTLFNSPIKKSFMAAYSPIKKPFMAASSPDLLKNKGKVPADLDKRLQTLLPFFFSCLFAWLSFSEGAQNLHHYINKDELSKAERVLGVGLGLAQLLVSALLAVSVLAASSAVLVHVAPIIFAVYGIMSALRYLGEAARSAYQAYSSKDPSYRKKKILEAVKFFLIALVELTFVGVVYKFSVGILEKVADYLKPSSLHVLCRVSQLGKTLLLDAASGLALAAVVKGAQHLWREASDPFGELAAVWRSAGEALRKSNQIRSVVVRTLANLATLMIQAVRIIGRTAEVALTVVLTLGVAAAIHAYRKKQAAKKMVQEKETSTEEGAAGNPTVGANEGEEVAAAGNPTVVVRP